MKSFRRAVTAIVVTVLAAGTASAFVPSAGAVSGSGSCSGGSCTFCLNKDLDAYGSSATTDRCAYGYLNTTHSVVTYHSGGATLLCAGVKSSSNGSGSNVAPVGVYCSTTNVYYLYTPWEPGYSPGYVTIFNRDNAHHLDFTGGAEYGA